MVTGNVAVVAFTTATEAGTVAAAGFDEDSATSVDPVVWQVMVTVAVVLIPAMAGVLVKTTDRTSSGDSVRTACAELPLADAVIVTVVTAATGWVVIGNVTVELPAVTVTVAGTEKAPGYWKPD